MSVQKLPENMFCASYLGREFRFCRQSALEQIEQKGLAARLVPTLMTGGISALEAQALASNCALLWQVLEDGEAGNVPEDILRRFTLGQIADLCALYYTQAEYTEYGRSEAFEAPEGGGEYV